MCSLGRRWLFAGVSSKWYVRETLCISLPNGAPFPAVHPSIFYFVPFVEFCLYFGISYCFSPNTPRKSVLSVSTALATAHRSASKSKRLKSLSTPNTHATFAAKTASKDRLSAFGPAVVAAKLFLVVRGPWPLLLPLPLEEPSDVCVSWPKFKGLHTNWHLGAV